MNVLFIVVNNWKNRDEFIWFDIGAVFYNRAITLSVGLFGIQFRLTLIKT